MIYFVDNCISRKIVEILRLAGADDGPHKLIHLQEVDAFPQGADTPDTEWMPHVARESWTAVTGDLRIKKKPQERALFCSLGLTTIFVHHTVTEFGRWDQVKFWVNHWRGIVKDTNRCEPGDNFQVDQHGKVHVMQRMQPR